MSNTFTLTVTDDAFINVVLTKVVDGTFVDKFRIYVQTVELHTSQQAVAGRLYKLVISQPSSPPPFGYDATGAVSELLFSAAATFTPDTADPFDGMYAFTSNGTTLIGTQTAQSDNVPITGYKFVLYTSTDSGSTWSAVPFTGTGVQYTFDIGGNTNNTYDVVGVAYGSADLLSDTTSPTPENDKPKLWFRRDYNTNPVPNALLTDGVSTVTIAGSVYVAYREPTSLNSKVTVGNDFSLYVPETNGNTDGVASAEAVEELESITIPYQEFNFMDLEVKLVSAGSSFTNGTTGASVSKRVERGDAIVFYAALPWQSTTVYGIEHPLATLIAVDDMITPTYYNAFLYNGSTYIFTMINVGGTQFVRLRVTTSYAATITTTIEKIRIRTGLPTVVDAVKSIP